jgi:hypothetical protein
MSLRFSFGRGACTCLCDGCQTIATGDFAVAASRRRSAISRLAATLNSAAYSRPAKDSWGIIVGSPPWRTTQSNFLSRGFLRQRSTFPWQ